MNTIAETAQVRAGADGGLLTTVAATAKQLCAAYVAWRVDAALARLDTMNERELNDIEPVDVPQRRTDDVLADPEDSPRQVLRSPRALGLGVGELGVRLGPLRDVRGDRVGKVVAHPRMVAGASGLRTDPRAAAAGPRAAEYIRIYPSDR